MRGTDLHDKALRQKASDFMRANHCDHRGNKLLDGNKIRCAKCNVVMGMMRSAKESVAPQNDSTSKE